MPNALSHESSAYLRSAAEQPVDWQPWSESAFERARRESKPVLLDIGAVWCHWCHVMDRESYENPETAALINRHFVAIKVDRDERPDVDARYQLAVSALVGQGGWPLTVFLTPAGDPFFGGTYFPPFPHGEFPGFAQLLASVAEAFARQAQQVEQQARQITGALKELETRAPGAAAQPEDFLPALLAAAERSFDAQHGGWGGAPKFPHPSLLELLLDRAARGEAAAGRMAFFTLRQMAAGGVYDQLGGGFHRYSVDAEWRVPHFEKMAADNAELLRCAVLAARLGGEPLFFQLGRDIVRWVDADLSDRERGGFYSSQDADTSLDDDGDFYTWTRAEARAVLAPDEFELLSRYYDIGERGEMRHDPARNVLFQALPLDSLAEELSLDLSTAVARLAAGRRKLLASRAGRRPPAVDTALYTGWNARFISAYLEAARGLRAPGEDEAGRAWRRGVRDFALRSLDRLLASRHPETGLPHRLPGPGERERGGDPRLLEDQAYAGVAALDAWECTLRPEYWRAAAQIAGCILTRYADPAGGFFDLPPAPANGISLLAASRKPLQDQSSPSANAAAILLLERLYGLTHAEPYRAAAAAALAALAPAAREHNLFSAAFHLAAQVHRRGPAQVLIFGPGGEPVNALWTAALATPRAGLTLLRLPHVPPRDLPPAVAESLAAWSGTEACALVCSGFSCQPPRHTPAELTTALQNLP